MELSDELKRELMFFENALYNRVFSEDKYDEHLSYVMQDLLTEDIDHALKVGSQTRVKKDTDYSEPTYVDHTGYETYPTKHGEFDNDYIFLNLFSNINILLQENERKQEAIASLRKEVDTLKYRVQQLADVHNAEQDLKQLKSQRIY